jgi:hypothetical protein
VASFGALSVSDKRNCKKFSIRERKLHFYTKQECETWLFDRKRRNPDAVPDAPVERIDYPSEPYRVFYVARWIATSLAHQRPALLWITEWGIWPSSENWHLYYKLRQSYSDQQLLHEAPGQLFLELETEDLASFLQVAMLSGWGGYLLTDLNYVNAFFSHDEYIDFFSDRDENLTDVRKELKTGQPATE